MCSVCACIAALHASKQFTGQAGSACLSMAATAWCHSWSTADHHCRSHACSNICRAPSFLADECRCAFGAGGGMTLALRAYLLQSTLRAWRVRCMLCVSRCVPASLLSIQQASACLHSALQLQDGWAGQNCCPASPLLSLVPSCFPPARPLHSPVYASLAAGPPNPPCHAEWVPAIISISLRVRLGPPAERKPLDRQPYLSQVAADLYLRAGGNELLNYLKVQEPACLTELTSCARDDTYEAVNAFIHRLLGTGEKLAWATQEQSMAESVQAELNLMPAGVSAFLKHKLSCSMGSDSPCSKTYIRMVPHVCGQPQRLSASCWSIVLCVPSVPFRTRCQV